jgi:hypothetical protein
MKMKTLALSILVKNGVDEADQVQMLFLLSPSLFVNMLTKGGEGRLRCTSRKIEMYLLRGLASVS